MWVSECGFPIGVRNGLGQENREWLEPRARAEKARKTEAVNHREEV